jgi:hypothetical protein
MRVPCPYRPLNVRGTFGVADNNAVCDHGEFLVQRRRMERIRTFVGQYHYKLVPYDASFKIAERKAVLAYCVSDMLVYWRKRMLVRTQIGCCR